MSTFKHIYNEKLKAIAEQEEQIDELDTKTLKSYLKKRMKTVDNTYGVHILDDPERHIKKVKGMKGAVDRISHDRDKKTAHMLKDMVDKSHLEVTIMSQSLQSISDEKHMLKKQLDKVMINRVPEKFFDEVESEIKNVTKHMEMLKKRLDELKKKNPKKDSTTLRPDSSRQKFYKTKVK